MKSKLLLLIILIGISATSFSQKYSKTYEQIINYNSRGNGKNATVRFKVNYDVFFGEPTRMHIAKVQSYGNVINYKGRTFTREEVGSEVFDNIKIGILNVSYDIYSGSYKVSTVTTKNIISWDVKGSPNWDVMWPGVSESRAKELFKKGYSIRNARLVNVEFSGFSGLDALIRKEEQEKQAALALIKKEEEKAEKLKEEKRLAEEKKVEEEKKLAEEKKVQKEKEAEEQKSVERNAANEKAKEEQRKREEAARKERERRAKNKKENEEYKRRVANQNAKNREIANTMAATNTAALITIGTVMYSGMGSVDSDYLFDNNQLYFDINFGYSFSALPIIFNSSSTTMVYSQKTGNNSYVTTEKDIRSVNWPINIDLDMSFGFENKYIGGELFGGIQPGFELTFEGFNFSNKYGGKIYAGIPNLKFFYDYNYGNRGFYKNDWIDVEENGEGVSEFTYKKHNYGLKITFGDYDRHHIKLGVIREYITGGNGVSSDNFRAIYSPDTEKIEEPEGLISDNIIKGYSFSWNKEHYFTLYTNIYPNYPLTGNGAFGGTSFSSAYFFEIGFIRQMKMFF